MAISDLGTTSYALGDLFKETTWTAGAAFRWVTPVGPLAVAYAIPIIRPAAFENNPDTGSAAGRLHIYFGYTF